jgi:hypothetical protein
MAFGNYPNKLLTNVLSRLIIAANGIGRANIHGFVAKLLLYARPGLPVNIIIPLDGIGTEIVWCNFGADVTTNTGVCYIVGALDIFL